MSTSTFKIYYNGLFASVLVSFTDPESIEKVDFDGESLLIDAFCEEYRNPISGYFIGKETKASVEYYKTVLHRMTLKYQGLEYICEGCPEIDVREDAPSENEVNY